MADLILRPTGAQTKTGGSETERPVMKSEPCLHYRLAGGTQCSVVMPIDLGGMGQEPVLQQHPPLTCLPAQQA